ncbi:MAG: hypothetical protein AYK19_06495 [Theionarchaea archaeon DG-70-1]|nr:MAG: hypothetical protein AYK19_06495 [Theionarchaea archaeon DG-70-1]
MKADVRVGYQAAVDLTIKEENLFWNQFNALLLANSILITAASFMGTKNQAGFTNILAVSGIFICFYWYQLTKRRNDYRHYYLFSAREIEENYLDFRVQTLSRGGDFANGSTIGMKINGKYKKHQKSFSGSLLDIRYWSYSIIIIFLAIHVIFLLRNIEDYCECLCTCLAGTIILVGLIVLIIRSKSKEGGDKKKIPLEDSTFEELLDIKEKERCKTYDQIFRRLITLYKERDRHE